MKKLIMLLGLILIVGGLWGETVTHRFSSNIHGNNAAAPGVDVDENIGFGSFKNNSGTIPTIYSNKLRLYQNSTKGGSIKIYASNGVTITNVVFYASDRTGPAAYIVDDEDPVNLAGGTTYTIADISATSEIEFYQKDSNSDNRIYVESFAVTYTAASSPTITTSTETLSGFTYSSGNGPSASQNFTISGSDLTNDIVIDPTYNYEVSNNNSDFQTTNMTLAQNSGTVGETTLYVRLKSGLAADNYNNEVINITSAGADAKTLTCSGEVTSSVASPTGFTATSSNASKIDLSWTKNGNGNNVLVVYDADNSFTAPEDGSTYSGNALGGTVIYNGSATNFNHQELTANTTYYYKAWSVDGDNKYSSGVTADATTPQAEPSNNPTNFSTSNIEQEEVTLTWTDATGNVAPDTYLIIGKTTDDIANPVDGTSQADDTLIKNINAGTETVTFSGLTASTNYYFKIFSYTNSATEVDYLTSNTPHVAVTTASNSGGASGDVFWSEDFSTGNNYTVTAGGEGQDGSSDYFIRTDDNPSEKISPTYENADGYFFAGQDIDDGGWTGSANPSTLTWSNINISGKTNITFRGSFASVATAKIDEADYIHVQYKIDAGSWENLIWFENYNNESNKYFMQDTNFDGTGDGNQLTSSFAEFSKEFSVDGANLELRIECSIDSGSEDIAFDSFKFESEAAPVFGPNAPTINASTDITETGFTLNWDAVDGATKYLLEVARNHNFANLVHSNSNVTGTSYSVSGLQSDKTYFIRMKSIDGDGNLSENYSDVITTKTTKVIEIPADGNVENFVVEDDGGVEVPAVDLTFGNGTAAPGNVSVAVQLNTEPANIPPAYVGKVVKRSLSIEPAQNNGSLEATVVFYYTDEEVVGLTVADLWLYRYHGGTWHRVDNCVVDEVNKKITATGVSEFSDWGAFESRGQSLPVELSSFSAIQTSTNFAKLNWITQTESDLRGYYIYRANSNNIAESVKLNTEIIASENSPIATTYSFEDKTVEIGETYYFWLESLEQTGITRTFGPVQLSIEEDDAPQADVPEISFIENSYPNPFNLSNAERGAKVTINFGIKENDEGKVEIFNLKGQKVKKFDGFKAGYHSIDWNAKDTNGKDVSSGVYFYRLKTNTKNVTNKLMIVK